MLRRLAVLEFSFSRIFTLHAVTFMMAFKVVWVYMESWLLKALNEKLMVLPFEVALQTAQFVMTLGAAGFTVFIQNFIVELAIMIIKRIAMDPVKFKVVRCAAAARAAPLFSRSLSLHTVCVWRTARRASKPIHTPLRAPRVCSAQDGEAQGQDRRGAEGGGARPDPHARARGDRRDDGHAAVDVPQLLVESAIDPAQRQRPICLP